MLYAHIGIATFQYVVGRHGKECRWYMSIFTAQRYASEVYAVFVHVSVCVSVTRRYCIRTAKHRIISKVADFNLSDLHLAPPPFGVTQFEFFRDLWHQKTRVPLLSCGVSCILLKSRFVIHATEVCRISIYQYSCLSPLHTGLHFVPVHTQRV